MTNIYCFIDEESIKPGESIPFKIAEGLENSKQILLFISSSWKKSKWTAYELESFFYNHMGGHNEKIIPIIIEETELPKQIKHLKVISYLKTSNEPDSLYKLVKEISDSCGNFHLKKLIVQQQRTIQEFPLLPGAMELSPRFGFLYPELIIDPKVISIKYPNSKPVSIYEWFLKYNFKGNVVIIGPPGIGKSTLLRSIIIRYDEICHNSQNIYYPIYITAAEILDYIYSGQSNFFSFVLKSLGLAIDNYKDNRFFLFVDSLDEVSEKDFSVIFDLLRSDISNEDIIWFGCRKEIFKQKIGRNPKLNKRFFEILEVQEWNVEEESLPFAKKYSKKTNQDNLYDQLINTIENIPEIKSFLRNPFEFTLILYMLSDPNLLFRSESFATNYDLYQTFYDTWLHREVKRGNNSLNIYEIEEIHFFIAMYLYKNKGHYLKQSVLWEKFPKYNLGDFSQESAVWALLFLREKFRTKAIEISRFWHETFGEFLVAVNVLNSFLSGGKNLYNSLQITYNNEVNRFIREALTSFTKNDIQKIYSNLVNLYCELVTNSTEENKIVKAILVDNQKTLSDLDYLFIPNNDENIFFIRQQILYYIGRLPLSSIPKILSFSYIIETDWLMKRTIILGAILFNNEKLELEYIESLTAESESDLMNRSVQLVYFGDIDGNIHTFRDNGNIAWDNTKREIYNRLKKSSDRDLSLRLWDLRTLYLFYASRNWNETISKEEYEIVKHCRVNHSSYGKRKLNLIELEKSNLLKIWSNMEKI